MKVWLARARIFDLRDAIFDVCDGHSLALRWSKLDSRLPIQADINPKRLEHPNETDLRHVSIALALMDRTPD